MLKQWTLAVVHISISLVTVRYQIGIDLNKTGTRSLLSSLLSYYYRAIIYWVTVTWIFTFFVGSVLLPQILHAPFALFGSWMESGWLCLYRYLYLTTKHTYCMFHQVCFVTLQLHILELLYPKLDTTDLKTKMDKAKWFLMTWGKCNTSRRISVV